jgi:hypothetical protein
MVSRIQELIEAGQVLSRAGDKEGARRLVEEALRLDPLSMQAQDLLSEITGRPLSSLNPFAPAPPDLFGSTPTRSNPGSNPFAKPAAKATKPATLGTAPPVSPATLPAGASAARGPTVGSPSRSPSESVASVFAPSAAQPIHPTTLPAGGPTPAATPPPPLDALDLIESPRPLTPHVPSLAGVPPPPPVDDPAVLVRKAQDQIDFADHSGALALLDRVLADHPQHAEALRLRAKCESTLVSMFESKLGDLNRRPRLKLRPDEVIWLNLDHRAGFVLAQIDGTVSLDDLFALSGMSRLDTARILAQLVEEKVITP